jgi:hypothetical protein
MINIKEIIIMEIEVKLKIRESELILSLEEAKKLYKILSELFT